MEKLQKFFQMQLFKKEFILIFLLYLWNPHQILNILKKKMNLVAYVFPKLRTVKDVVR